MKRKIADRSVWDLVQAQREQRMMTGIRPEINWIEEVAKVDVVDVALISPKEQVEYRMRLARRL